MSNFLSKISSIIPCNIQIIKVDFIRFMSYYGIVKKRISEILRYFPTFLQNSTSFSIIRIFVLNCEVTPYVLIAKPI